MRSAAWIGLLAILVNSQGSDAFAAKTKTQVCSAKLLGIENGEKFVTSLEKATIETLANHDDFANEPLTFRVTKEFKDLFLGLAESSGLEPNALLLRVTAAGAVLQERLNFLRPVTSGAVEETELTRLQWQLINRMMNQRKFPKGVADFSVLIPGDSMSALKALAVKNGRGQAEMISIIFEFADELLQAGGPEAEELIQAMKRNAAETVSVRKVPLQRVLPRDMKARIKNLKIKNNVGYVDYAVAVIDFAIIAWHDHFP